jgi:biuret amidohydrolase
MERFHLQPSKTALLVIDMMNGFLKPGAPLEIRKGRELIPKLNTLISVCRDKGIPIVFIVHAHRKNKCDIGLFSEFVPEMEKFSLIEDSPDVDVYGEIDRRDEDVLVIKRAFSAFFGTDLDHVLRVNGIETVIICGVATHSCCEATARDARHRNYNVVFLSDGTATYDYLPDMGWGRVTGEEIQKVVLTIMAHRNAEVLCFDDVLERLSRS